MFVCFDCYYLVNLGVEVIEIVLKVVIFYIGKKYFIVFEGGYYGCIMGVFVFIYFECLCVLF